MSTTITRPSGLFFRAGVPRLALVLFAAVSVWSLAAAASDGPGSNGPARRPAISPDGAARAPESRADHAVYRITAPDVSRTLMIRHSPLPRVILELKGPSLIRERHAWGRSGRSLEAAVARLEAQHTRVAWAMAAIAAENRPASRRRAETLRILFDYRRTFNGMAVVAPEGVVERLKQLPDVEAVHPDTTVRADLSDSVPLIGASDLHAQGLTGAGVVVGILDTGIDYTHPELGGGFGPGFKVIGGYDFVNGDGDPMDDHYHGTHVAGIVSGSGARKGVAPGAALVAYKVLDGGGWGQASAIIAAIERAVDPDGNPATADALDVINLSLGGPGDADDPMSQAIDGAAEAGVLPVVAAGNDGSGYWAIGCPAAARRALTVGASDKIDHVAPFSSRGPSSETLGFKPDLVAPGDSITSTVTGGLTRALSGTSMAAPHVAGAAALLLEARPELSPDAVKSVLMTTARDLGQDVFTQGTGRIDVAAAARRTTIVHPAAISFGLDDLRRPVFHARATVAVTNLAGTTRRFSGRALDAGWPAGVQVTVSPAEVELAPGATAALTVELNVDNTTVPNPSRPPYAYTGRIQIRAEGEDVQVPVAFFKAARLRLTFDAAPGFVIARNASGNHLVTTNDRQASVYLPPGAYDLVAHFPFLSSETPDRLRFATVVRHGLVVEAATEETVRSTEAVHVVDNAPKDEQGQPVLARMQWCTLRTSQGLPLPVGLQFGWSGGLNGTEFAFSALDDRYLVDLMASGQRPTRPEKAYSFYWRLKGIHESRTLTNESWELTDLEFRAGPEAAGGSVWMLNFVGTFLEDGFQAALPPSRTWHHMVMAPPAADFEYGYVDHTVIAPDGFLLFDTPALRVSGDAISAHLLTPKEGVLKFERLYETTRTTFDVGLEPYTWFGRFHNRPDEFHVGAAHGVWPWLFVGQMMDEYAARGLPYELRQRDVVIHAGTLPGLYQPDLRLPVAPGTYTFTAKGPSGDLLGQPTATTVKATFDTRAADPNPPVLSHLRILANGVPAKAFGIGEKAEIRFRMQDEGGLRQVQLLFRVAQGPWLPWPLEAHGDELVGRLPLGPAFLPDPRDGVTRSIPVSLRIEATDDHGNTLETEMTPAYARLIPQGPAVP